MVKKLKKPTIPQLPEADKYIYESTIYKIWNRGACLVSTKVYRSDKPITLSSNELCKEFQTYKLVRYFELIAAPKN